MIIYQLNAFTEAFERLVNAVISIYEYISSNLGLIAVFIESIPQYLAMYSTIAFAIPLALAIPLTIVLLIQVVKAIIYGG